MVFNAQSVANQEWNAFRVSAGKLYPQLKRAPLKYMKELYRKAQEAGFSDTLKSEIARQEDPSVVKARTRDEFYSALATKIATKETITGSIQDTWNDKMATAYEAEVGTGKSFTLDTIDAKVPWTPTPGSLFDQQQAAVVDANNARVGQYVSGVGIKNVDGTFGRGATTNAGGGKLDTQVAIDETGTGGDIISQGPRSVNTATKTLRPKLDIAGGEDVRPSYADNLQSDALFESFSWVPDGYGLGEHNRLHLQNRQNDSLRFGMERMSQPRRYELTDMPHAEPSGWLNSMTLGQIEQLYVEKVGREMMERQAMDYETEAPSRVLNNDFNRMPSYKGLPRQSQGPSPYQVVADNLQQLLPARDPAGYHMNALPYQDSRAGTYGMRRMNTFRSLMR